VRFSRYPLVSSAPPGLNKELDERNLAAEHQIKAYETSARGCNRECAVRLH